jgi:acyl carrier protein
LSDIEVKVKQVLAEVSGQSPDSFEPSTEMGSVPGWDSVGHLTILQKLSDHFEKEVPFDQLTELTSVSKISAFFSNP